MSEINEISYEISFEVSDSDHKCGPELKFKNGHCAPLDLIIEFAKAWNDNNCENKIKLSERLDTVNPGKYKICLVKQLQDKMSPQCGNSQKCWLKQPFINRINEKYKFFLEARLYRPRGPNSGFKWLNTFDIMKVMEQYEYKYKDYKFMGAVPIDFDKLSLLIPDTDIYLANLDFNKLEAIEKTRLGIIFNLDTHDKPGSHWVGMFIDLKKGHALFFDSYGSRPPKEVRELMLRLDRYFQSKNIKDRQISYNKLRHQYKNSECGVYSIAFILRMLAGSSFNDINQIKVTDDEINQCRNIYFSKDK